MCCVHTRSRIREAFTKGRGADGERDGEREGESRDTEREAETETKKDSP